MLELPAGCGQGFRLLHLTKSGVIYLL